MWSGSGVDVTQDPNETTVPIPIDQALNSAQQAANSPESSPPASTASTDTADLAGTANTADTQSPTDPQSLAQSSATMALGTIASRLTGMVRDIAIVAAIGFGVFGDTYSVANTVPNIIYILIAGGALNAIFIPQLVRHLEHDLDKGNEYADRLLTLVTLILLGVTFIVTIAAPLVIGIYGPRAWSAADVNSAVLFARFCLPQILFYGLFAMFSQVLNSRKKFTAPMFAPIVNNVVVVITALVFLSVVASKNPTTGTITAGQIALLGIGTTLGIAAQAAVLVPVMAKAGYTWRPRFDFRGQGLGKVRYLAGWTFLFVLTNQLSYIVVTRLAAKANVSAATDPQVISAGFTSYSRAYLLFMLPHSIVTVSIVTFLLPQMSRAVAAGRRSEVARDVGEGTLMASVIIVPACVALFLAGPKISAVLFGFGAATAQEASFVGVILQAFLIGLVPFTIFYVLLRGFYAFEDTKTPALINIGMNVVNVVAALTFYSIADAKWKVPALALGYSLSYVVTVPITWRILSKTTGALPTFDVIRSLVRMALASVFAGLAIWAVLRITGNLLGDARWAELIEILLALGVGGAIYIGFARAMRIEQIHEVTDLVRSRIQR